MPEPNIDRPRVDKIGPGVPSDLKYVELRLPGTFRELVADARFTDEDIGRIIRCIALNTDFYLTPRIEPEVLYYRQDQERRNRVRLRVMKFRKNKKSALEGSDENVGSISVGVTVTETKPTAGTSVGHSSSSEKITSQPHRKDTPYNPPRKEPPSPLEDAAAKSSGVKTALVDGIIGSSNAGGVVDDGSEMLPGLDGFSDKPQEAMSLVGKKPIAVPVIENDPKADAHEPASMSDSRSANDSRLDAAWIPGKFAIFWKSYPKKVAKNGAMKAFTKIIKSQQDVEQFMRTLLASLESWKANPQWTKDKGQFIPYPATWLNAGHWEDSADENSPIGLSQGKFLAADTETDMELIKRMTGG